MRGPLRRTRRGGFGRPSALATLAALLMIAGSTATGAGAGAGAGAGQRIVRFATFNTSLNRAAAGQLLRDLASGEDAQARVIATIIQRVRPDVLLLNEFDHDGDGLALREFEQRYLGVAQLAPDARSTPEAPATRPLRYDFRFGAPVNTGVPSGLDLDRDGRSDGPGDAWGFGAFPGQYGMAVLSRFPLDASALRSFRELRWASMPGALIPPGWYPRDAEPLLRLSSKSHWDLPLQIEGRLIHLLASHPTPPAFDGPEDRNGRRNHDEIRLWADYVSPERSAWIVDDAGRRGGLDPSAAFVIAGDLNADPFDGGSHPDAIRQLLEHPRVHREAALGRWVPASAGAEAAAARDGATNATHRGAARQDTADFGDRGSSPGNLRVDYVLPSADLVVCGSGVWWPVDDPAVSASDHRLVWVDVAIDGRCEAAADQ